LLESVPTGVSEGKGLQFHGVGLVEFRDVPTGLLDEGSRRGLRGRWHRFVYKNRDERPINPPIIGVDGLRVSLENEEMHSDDRVVTVAGGAA